MKVPYYGFKKDNTKTYQNNDYTWVDLKVFLNVLTPEIIKKFENINALEDENWIDKFEKIAESMNMPPVAIGDNFVKFSDFMISAKLLYMTGFACKYGLWKVWSWTHHWIDLILPKNTPIESFSDWEVYEILENSKWWGNCIVIKSDDLYFCYAHLNKINVKKWDEVKKWDIIWTCWNTGNSTTYHLHFQIDKKIAPFHPYWESWDNPSKIEKFCIDGWEWLRENYNEEKEKLSEVEKIKTKDETDEMVSDLVKELSKATNAREEKVQLVSAKTKKDDDLVDKIQSTLWNKLQAEKINYLEAFKRANVIKWDNGKLYLDRPLTRYQLTLILYRLKKAGLLDLPSKKCKFSFKDLWRMNDYEFKKALDFVVCNKILHWDNGYFLPWKYITWIQFLAVIWRVFWKLSDNKWKLWYKNYLDWAVWKWLIPNNWQYLFKSVPRQEVINILGRLIYENVV